MQTLDKIWKHPLYQDSYKRLETLENNREFCRHQISHLLDVARIAHIDNLERALGLSKECIYAAALLHDIGKASQYEEGIPHEVAGKELAASILADVSMFSEDEKEMILQAILEHRRLSEDMSVMGRLLYESDKRSRSCFACLSETACNWDCTKKNLSIEV